MSDPKDELGARFNERRADADQDEETNETSDTEKSGGPNNTNNTNKTNDPDSIGSTDNTNNTDNTPGPDRDETATRHRRQVPMYLPDEKADKINTLYERLDGRSKIAGDGGIEKHADFMEALVDFAVEHEDELAASLDIDNNVSN
jgi:hypothetical protein